MFGKGSPVKAFLSVYDHRLLYSIKYMEADRRLTGKSLRNIRQAYGIALRDLAAKSGCSAGFISQIERGKTSPSLESLKRICRVLNVTVVDLLMMNNEQREARFLPGSPSAEVVTKWPRASLHHILPPYEQTNYSVLMLELPPHGRTPQRSARRSMKEVALVVKGRVTFTVEKEKYDMSQGDLIYFDLMSPHAWKNAHSEAARVILFNSNFTEVADIG